MVTAYDPKQMRILVNRDPAMTEIYMRFVQELSPGGFSQTACDAALRRVFDEEVAEKEPTQAWVDAKPKQRDCLKVPKGTPVTEVLQKLMNVHGWRGLMYAFVRLSEIKHAEMTNGGFDDQAGKWAKFGVIAQKQASADLMT